MKKLAKRYSIKCMEYKQLMRKESAAIYEVWMKKEKIMCPHKDDHPDSNAFIQYEVVKIKKKEKTKIFNREYPAMEEQPTANKWGAFGWTFFELNDAMKKYENL